MGSFSASNSTVPESLALPRHNLLPVAGCFSSSSMRRFGKLSAYGYVGSLIPFNCVVSSLKGSSGWTWETGGGGKSAGVPGSCSRTARKQDIPGLTIITIALAWGVLIVWGKVNIKQSNSQGSFLKQSTRWRPKGSNHPKTTLCGEWLWAPYVRS